MSSRLSYASLRFLAITACLMPLLVIPSSFIFPFIVPKILFFRSLVILMGASYLILLLWSGKAYRPRRTPITLLVIAFYTSMVVSTFTGVDWYRSFWDNHERMLGIFTIGHFVLYYVILTSVFKTEDEWWPILRAFLMAGSLVMIIALLQKINPDMLLNRGQVRVSATLGNSIYLGGYGLWIICLGIYLAIKEKTRFWQSLAGIGAVLGFFGIFWSGTRGSFVGLCAGLVVGCAAYAIAAKQGSRLRKGAVGLLVAGGLIMVVLFAFRHTPAVQHIPAVGSLLNTSLSGGSAGTRIMAWQVAVQAWKERPIFGWGPNNYYYAFNEFYRPEFLEYGWSETWFDNAHNIIVNTLTVQGLVGVALYLLLFAASIVSLWRAYRRGVVDVHLAVFVTAFLVAHLTQNIFVFENPTSYLYFFFLLAFCNSAAAQGVAEEKPAGRFVSLPARGLILLVALFFIYITNVNPARANMATLDAIKGIYRGEPARPLFEAAARIPTPHIDDIRGDFGRTVEQMISHYVEAKRGGEAKDLLAFTIQELEKNRAVHPLDIRTFILQAQLSEQAYGVSGDRANFFQAEKILLEALSYSPKRQQIQYQLATIQMYLGNIDGAAALFQESIDNDPRVGEGWVRLAMLHYDTGRLDEAKRLLEAAAATGVKFTKDTLPAVELLRAVERIRTATSSPK